MGNYKSLLSLILVLISTLAIGQISLNDLKKAGINSESDLSRLGVSKSEIDALKQEYVQEKQVSSDKKNVGKSSAIPEKPLKEKTITTKSEKDTAIKELVFGQSLFRSGAVSIQRNSDRIMPASNYILGSGDRISVTIWGTSQFSGEFTLDEFGNITPNLVGRISLKGKTFSQTKKILKRRFGEVYRFNSSQIAINISFSKVISVNIVGEVVSPGTYSIPSINSAFNILSLSKGLTKKGSVRNIAVVRNGKIINNLDIYEFMNNPKKESFVHLFDGDFILVPALGNLVNIKGQVQRTGNYELKESETLSDLLHFAGGFKPLANKSAISIIRQSLNGKKVQSYSYEEAKDVKLQNGDEIVVGQSSQSLSNKITISGEVFTPGIFEYKKGQTLHTFIKRANGLTPEAYLKTAHIYRLADDHSREIIQINLEDSSSYMKFQIMDLDEIKVFNKKNFIDPNFVIINGVVRKPGKVDYKSGMTLNDLITLSGGAYPQADLNRIEIERIDFSVPNNDTINYVKVITKSFSSDKDFDLEPFDIINIRALPEFKFQESIQVIGEVKYPGKYSLSGDGVKISDIIQRAGGLTHLAYGQKAKIMRTEDSVGVILLDLEMVLERKNSPFNYSLRPNDKVIIPRINDIVSISGAIGSQFINKEDKINVPFKKAKPASFYIKKYAGGYAKKANKRKVYAVTLNGQVKRTKLWGLIKPKIEKGDLIVVNYKEKKEPRKKGGEMDWNQAIESTTIKLTGVLTLWILINSAFN